MKNLLVGVAVLGILAGSSISAYADSSWKAVAIVRDSDQTKYWYGYGIGYSEEDARHAAIENCENTSGRTCNVTRSVPEWWTLVVANCGGALTIGGSKGGVEGALARAAYNARRGGEFCHLLQSF